MKNCLAVFAFGLLLLAPVLCFAADSGHGGQGTHEVMPGMEHGGHGDEKVAADMIMIGEQIVDGVKGMAHLKDVKATMTKMGMKETHHFMMMFRDKDGKAITTGSVAVKIKGPDGKEGPAIKLVGMEEHFGADVVLDKKGAYVFTVGTQLTDGVKRQFAIKSEIK